MKKKDITYQEKLNELRLDISHPNNKGIAFVFLEGDSDIRLFRKLFDLDNCKVETIPGGKFKLEACVDELVNVYPLIIGIRDADFIHLGEKPYSKMNLFLTDLHDMEMLIISEDDVFSALMFKCTLLMKNKHLELRNKIITTIEQIGLLKWLNDKENLEYKFEFGFQDLISFANLEIDFNQYFLRLLLKSPNAKITDISIVSKKLKKLRETNPDAFQLCNGHDFMKALSKYIREECEGKALDNEIISSFLRMTFTRAHFEKTRLFNDTKSWAGCNHCILYV
jgi:hypothetical protein